MPRRPAAAGFTLIELVLVIVMTGTLAVVALPRMVDGTDWQLRAFSDRLQGELQSARRLALMQRRPLTASISPGGLSVTDASANSIASLACPPATPACVAESGTRSVIFNAGNSGAATTSTGAALTVTISGGSTTRAFTIENDTGLVH